MADTLIAIPARWNSSRFPGKPLAVLEGMSLLHRTIASARACTTDRPSVDVVVATDDERIARHAAEIGCVSVMTDPAITSGTGRVLAACKQRPIMPRAVVNMQGDNPFVSSATITRVIDALEEGHAVVTPVVQLDWATLDALREQKRSSPFSGTTCVSRVDGRALWFSKQILPAVRDEGRLRRRTPMSPVFRHIGLYGYTVPALERFEAEPPSPLELLEGLEQLRFVEMDVPVITVAVEPSAISMSGIDTPADLALAASLLRRLGDPHRP